jgi:hypothetical protein
MFGDHLFIFLEGIYFHFYLGKILHLAVEYGLSSSGHANRLYVRIECNDNITVRLGEGRVCNI